VHNINLIVGLGYNEIYMRTVYFIADLHLRSEKPKVSKAFIEFCNRIKEQKPYLYIMGDLFDAWLGDDMMEEFEEEVATAISSIHQAGGKNFFQAGNRDFLIGERFLTKSYCQLLSEETVVEHEGVRMFLAHGDSLCTADKNLQKARATTRNSAWIKTFLAKSKEERLRLKEEYFAQSKSHIKNTDSAELKIPIRTLKEKLTHHNCDVLIHGHIHKPKQQVIKVDKVPKTIVALGDWTRKCWFAHQQGEGVQLDSFSLR